jgi:hypothetical protein
VAAVDQHAEDSTAGAGIRESFALFCNAYYLQLEICLVAIVSFVTSFMRLGIQERAVPQYLRLEVIRDQHYRTNRDFSLILILILLFCKLARWSSGLGSSIQNL